MAPERVAHGRTKFRIARRLAEAIEAAHLECEVLGDGMTVQVDADTIYEPDALVRCGPPLDDNAIKVLDPVILVEVVSPSSRARNSGSKLEDYFRLPSVRHYLIVKTENRAVIHHQRDAAGAITTRIIRDGTDPARPARDRTDRIVPASGFSLVAPTRRLLTAREEWWDAALPAGPPRPAPGSARRRVLQAALDHPFQRPRAIGAVDMACSTQSGGRIGA